MMHLLLYAHLSTASALTAPSGWTQLAPDRAERVPGTPGQGELIELSSSVDETASSLSLAMVSLGLSVQQSTVDGDRLNLFLSDGRLGRAMWDAAAGRWLVLLVDASVAPQVDPDALLLTASVVSAVPTSVWGEPAPEVMAGGGDGSPWGAGDAAVPAASWVSDASESWSQDASMLGIWECSVMLGGSPAQLTFTFEADGTVRLEQQVSGRTERHTGQWSTRSGHLQLQSLPGTDSGTNAYQALGDSLRFSYDRTRLTLYRQ